ncbi:MAG: sugar phosphate isomerase/epimerase [Anaerolineae bacterium]|nr:sugar phosphate isomerase/epimerase [Anaerolineae bacterium]
MALIACQLIVYGARARADLPGVLREIAEAGYAGFEGGGPGTMPASEMKALLADVGLKLAGVHTGYEGLDALDAILPYMQALDCSLLMCSGVGERGTGLAAYEAAAERFNAVGRRCSAEGIRFCYHNHSWEFAVYDGVVALDRLYALTDPQHVHLCVDVYWVQHGGRSPAAFLRQHLDRLATVHLKDMGPDGAFLEVGQGVLDFPEIMDALAGKQDLDWLIVEQDTTTRTPAGSIALSRTYIRETLGL